MLIKASAPEGDILKALGYCTKGEALDDSLFPRPTMITFPPGVELLRGNLSDLLHVAPNVPHKVKYQSLILAWSPAEKPTPVQLGEITDDVLRVAFAGLALERFCFCVFLHRSHSVVQGIRIPRIDIHVLAAAIDLATMHAYKIAPPGWEKRYYPIRDFYNARYGWSSPLDPALARLCQPAQVSSQIRAIRLRIKAERQKAEIEKRKADRRKATIAKYCIPMDDASTADEAEHIKTQSTPLIPYKQNILDDLEERARNGKLTSRQDVLAAIDLYGKVTKIQSTSISVVPHGRNRELKLRGTLFHEDFHPGMIPKPRTFKGVMQAARKNSDKEWDDERLKLALESWNLMHAQWRYWKQYNQSQRRYRRDGKGYAVDWECNDAQDLKDEDSITIRVWVMPRDVEEQMRIAENRAKGKGLLEFEGRKTTDGARRSAEMDQTKLLFAREFGYEVRAAQEAEKEKMEVEKADAEKPKKEAEKITEKEYLRKVDAKQAGITNKDLEERLAIINAVRAQINEAAHSTNGNAIESSVLRRP